MTRSAESPAKPPSISRLVTAQLSSYPRSYWIGSLLLFVMLLFILPAGQGQAYISLLSLGTVMSMFMPIIFLAGLLYSFRSWNKEMRMIESISPYPPALLMMSRVMITCGLNILFGLAASLYLSTTLDRFQVLPFMLQWFSMMMLISGAAAFVMMRVGIKSALAAGVLLWMSWNGLDYMLRSPQPGLEWLADFRTPIYTLSLLAGLMLISVAYRRSLRMRVIV